MPQTDPPAFSSSPSSPSSIDRSRDDVLLEAAFDRDAIVKYHWAGLLPVCLFIVTIPIVIVVAIVYSVLLDRIIASWSATLTRRSLIVRKGVFNKVERTIPLEKITDLSATQGPIMRYFGLTRIGVETAGQSTGGEGGALVSLIGIVDTDRFRAAVLTQRDLVTGAAHDADHARTPVSQSAPAAPVVPGSETLADIAATLHRIETLLERRGE